MNISVIIPAYNREKHIDRCLQSILNQTVAVYEIIVVDDCSSDGTRECVRKFSDNNVKLIELDHNSGAQTARNRGIREAKGDWIAFCDSDDEWLPDKLERQIARLEKSRRLVCAGGAKVLQNNKTTERWIEGNSGYVFHEVLLAQTYLLFQTLLVKKECLQNINYLDENVSAYQEWDTAIRLSQMYEIDYINEPLFIYTIHDKRTIFWQRDIASKGKRYLFHKYKDIAKEQLGYQGLHFWYNELSSAYTLKDIRHWRYRLVACGCFWMNMLKGFVKKG